MFITVELVSKNVVFSSETVDSGFELIAVFHSAVVSVF